MNILVGSYCFSPDVGGIESVSASLATHFAELGHQVQVVTATAREDARSWPFRIWRCPSPRDLLEQVKWCGVFFQNNVSLQYVWPALLLQKPWVVTHATWITRPDGQRHWQDHLKRALLPRAHNVAISRAVAADIPTRSIAIPNPYDAGTFRLFPEISRSPDLIFVGRLVSQKGVDLLITALQLLRRDGLTPSLSVVGGGPEEEALRAQVEAASLGGQIRFLGRRTGDELARILNGHSIMVVPSRVAEPFGVVAVEGIACGCVVVGSEQGGLPEAIGPCGATFPNGDAHALAQALRRLLEDASAREDCLAQREEHLARFRPEKVARDYVELFERVVR